MAEVVGLAASIVAVAELAKGVVHLCKTYIDGVKDAPRDLRAILVEASTLNGLLDSITLLQDTPLLVEHHDMLSVQVNQVHEVLSDIERLLGSIEVEEPDSKQRRVALSLSTLAWPLKKPRIMQRLEDISKCKSTISLILLADTSKDLKEMKQDLQEIKNKLSDDERRKILEKLIIVNPSPNHAQAYSLHEPHTSSWITRSEEWKAWLEGDLRLFWVHGIPGAGKTILASFMIEHVKLFCQQTSSTTICGWSYYYCHHNRPVHTGESAPFLGWIISQLSKQAQYIPVEIEKAFQSGNITISSDLIAALAVLARRFEKIYIVIDALDECQHRPSFLALLQNIYSSPMLQNIHLLVTSRDELDIRRVMTPISTSLSMTNSLVDEDIRNYVESQVKSDPKLTRWPQELLHEVENALADGAKGMFRWAACQLEILRRLNTISAVRKALADLPETLDEIYERILRSIPKESKHLAFRTLSILCAPSERKPYTISSLAEAIRWTDLSGKRPDDALLEVDAIYEFCICLITTTLNGTVTLAHYTVKEFLESSRILNGPVRDFFLSQDAVARLFLKTIFNRLLWTEEPDSESSLKFLFFCAETFPYLLRPYRSILLNDDHIYSDLCKFLHPSNGHFPRIVQSYKQNSYKTPETMLDELSDRNGITHGGSTALVARLCLFHEEELASKFIHRLDESELEALLSVTVPFSYYGARRGNCTLLEIAAELQVSSFLRDLLLLLLKSRRPIGETNMLFTISIWTDLYFEEAEEFVELALKTGANPNPTGAPSTPLQNAVYYARNKMVAALLAAGADPDAVGEKGLTPEIVDQRRNYMTSFDDSENNLKPLDLCRVRLERGNILSAKENGWLSTMLEELHILREIETLLVMHGATTSRTDELVFQVDSYGDGISEERIQKHA